MDLLFISTILSLISAIAITIASFWSWYQTNWNGEHVSKKWPKKVLAGVTVLLLISLVLLVLGKFASNNLEAEVRCYKEIGIQKYADLRDYVVDNNNSVLERLYNPVIPAECKKYWY